MLQAPLWIGLATSERFAFTSKELLGKPEYRGETA
jgi:hypothetical protein